MPLKLEHLTKFLIFFKQTYAFLTFPFSLFLIGLEELIEIHFSCPCKYLNIALTVVLFIGPALFFFALTYFVLRPCKHRWFCCPKGGNVDTQHTWPEDFAACLIPPVMWVFILLLDGDYVACAMTDWNGVYVFDIELNRSWCKPTEETYRTETEMRDLTRNYVRLSQFSGYVMISALSFLSVVLVSNYDCCISEKCDCCPNQLLSCCGRTGERQNEGECEGLNEPDPDLNPNPAPSPNPAPDLDPLSTHS